MLKKEIRENIKIKKQTNKQQKKKRKKRKFVTGCGGEYGVINFSQV